MTIYVGRWDLLPEDWEGINGLYEKSEEEIKKEVLRQLESETAKPFDDGDPIPGVYTPAEFEETFNGDDEEILHGTTYFVKFFENGKSVLAK